MSATEFATTAPHPDHPDAQRTYAVFVGTRQIGHVCLHTQDRPKGTTIRRLWYAILPPEDDADYPRPFDTRGAAASALAYRDRVRNTPPAPPPPDPTGDLIRHVRDTAGTPLAAWLAAAITAHHLRETIRTRHTNPADLRTETARAATWLAIGADPVQ